jgi:hypothetical protein
MTARTRRWLTASDTRLVVNHMTRIRIVIAAALVLAAGFAGGTAHAVHSQAPAPARAVALASGPIHEGPILCC